MSSVQFATWTAPEDVPVDIPCIGACIKSDGKKNIITDVLRLCHNVFLVTANKKRFLVYDNDAAYVGSHIKKKFYKQDLSVIGTICQIANRRPIVKGKSIRITAWEYGSGNMVNQLTSEVKHITRIALGVFKVVTNNGSVYYIIK